MSESVSNEENCGHGDNRQHAMVKGGSSGLAALIIKSRQQAGGLKDINRAPVSSEMRYERSLSAQINPDQFTPNLVPKPPRVNRIHSVPNDMAHFGQTNGAVTKKVPLMPPSVLSVQSPPSKPPRTRSTSPNAFHSVEEEELLEWKKENLVSNGVSGENQEKQVVVVKHRSPGRKAPPPPINKHISTATSDHTTHTKREPPKRPMLPPSKTPSKAGPTSSKSSFHSESDINSDSSSKVKDQGGSKVVEDNYELEGRSHSSSNELELKYENEILKQKLMILEQQLEQQSKLQSNPVTMQEPEIANPLVADHRSVRSQSRSMSPFEEEQVKPKPKPTPLPRTRIQTTSDKSTQKKIPLLLATSSVPANIGFVPPEKVQIQAVESGSPVPKPRFLPKQTGKVNQKSSVNNVSDHVTVRSQSSVDEGLQKRISKPEDVFRMSFEEDALCLSDSSASNCDSTSENIDKAKSIEILKKLIPTSRTSSPVSAANTSTIIKDKETHSGSQVSSSSHSGTKISSSSHSGTKVVLNSKSATPSVQSNSKPIPVPSIQLVVTPDSQSWNPRTRQSLGETDSEKENGSDSQNVERTKSPISSSVPPPSLLSKSTESLGETVLDIQAPLNSVAFPVPSAAGKAKYKKITLSDSSWIKKKESIIEETDDEERKSFSTSNDDYTSLSQPSQPVAISPSSSSDGANSHQQLSQPLPFRSHPILPGPKIVQQSFLPPLSQEQTKPSQLLSGKVSPSSRAPFIRTESMVESSASKKRHSFTKSSSNDDLPSAISKGKQRNAGKLGKKQSQVPPKSTAKLAARKGTDSRTVSMLIDQDQQQQQDKADLSSSMVCSMPRGVQPSEVLKQSKQKKGFLGLFRNKTAMINNEASPLEEATNGSDSGSDDEKGGTIKKMPKLRHVADKRTDLVEDDDEPEYHQLFEYVFVVSLKEASKGKLTTEITYTYPPTTKEFSGKDEALKSIPQFCFPDIDQWKPTKSYKSEKYSFVLTDIEGNRRYGYCRRLLPEGSGPRLPEVFCIVSPLGCFSLYEDILDHVEERRAISKLSVFNFLKAISANPFPRPGRSVEVKVFGARGSGMETQTFTRPMDSRLEHVEFSLLFSTLSQRQIIKLFSSLLMERRVIFCANSLSLMTGCAHALMALLYPFEWQHVFIPVLPSSLIDFVCSPLPYIIGLNPASCKQFDDMEMEEAVIINLDKGKFLKKIGDESSILPSKLFQFLEGKLSASIISSEYSKRSSRRASGQSRADDIVVNTFMTFFAYLYGNYREEMKPSKSGYKEFQRASYISRFSSKSTRRFLEAFHMTQMFENFIEQRENPSKAETLAASLFEKELPELKERCQDIEIFSSKSKFDRWKMKKNLAKAN